MLKKVEILANVAVTITSVVLCTVLAKNYFFSASKRSAAATTISEKSALTDAPRKLSLQPGVKISIQGIDWTQSDGTLLLALSTNCHFCTESASFYQKLQQQKPSDLRLVAVLPQTVEQSRIYLNGLGVLINDVVQSPLGSVSVSGTPTLILIDRDGTVRDSWVGKLSDEEATKVINRINERIAD